MKATTILATLFATAAIAIPTGGGGGGGETPPTEPSCPGGGGGGDGGSGGTYDPCSGLYDSALCCATDVLGVADLNCAPPPTVPTSATSFSSVCATIGQRARCCVLPVLDQAVLCQAPVGVPA